MDSVVVLHYFCSFLPISVPPCLALPIVASLLEVAIFTMWLTFSRFVMAHFTKLSKIQAEPSKKVSLPMASSKSF